MTESAFRPSSSVMVLTSKSRNVRDEHFRQMVRDRLDRPQDGCDVGPCYLPPPPAVTGKVLKTRHDMPEVDLDEPTFIRWGPPFGID